MHAPRYTAATVAWYDWTRYAIIAVSINGWRRWNANALVAWYTARYVASYDAIDGSTTVVAAVSTAARNDDAVASLAHDATYVSTATKQLLFVCS